MGTRAPSHSNHHHPIQWFTVEHPYAPDWALLITGTLVGLLLWYWNS